MHLKAQASIIASFKKESIIFFTIIHTIHLLSAFIYGGFLIVDNLFLVKQPKELGLDKEEAAKVREAFMKHVRKVVPNALLLAVATGLYMITHVFGKISPDGLSTFQIMLSMKAFLGIWLGIRGFNQKFFKINPFMFTSHLFPFISVIIIIILSQMMYI